MIAKHLREVPVPPSQRTDLPVAPAGAVERGAGDAVVEAGRGTPVSASASAAPRLDSSTMANPPRP
jgi:hypothetical protein